MDKHNIVVYGWDDFGFALAHTLSKLDGEKYSVRYHTKNEQILGQLIEHGSYKKGMVSSSLDGVEITQSDENLFENARTLYIDAPLEHMRHIAKKIKESSLHDATIVGVNAGIESASGLRISEVMAKELEGTAYHYVQLGGDQDAYALLRDEPLRIGITSVNSQHCQLVKDQLKPSSLRLIESDDIATAEIAQALGGVLALYSGLLSGIGYSMKTVTGLTCELAEQLKQAAVEQFGVKPQHMTAANPFWANSQWVVCNTQNADHQLGLAIAEGVDADKAASTLIANQRHITSTDALLGFSKYDTFTKHELLNTLLGVCIERTAMPEDIRAIVSPYFE